MLTPGQLVKGLVSRFYPSPTPDGPESEGYARFGRDRSLIVQGSWPTDHQQCDEGTLMIATMAPAQTALQLGISAAYAQTAVAFALYNSDTAGAPGGGRRIFPKALKLACSTVGTSGVDLRYAVVVDPANRAPTTISNASGANQGPGTAATATAYRAPAYPTNMGVLSSTPAGVPYFPFSTAAGAPPTIPAPSPQARIIEGNGYIKNSALVAKDQVILQFGSADKGGTFQGAAALAKIVEHVAACSADAGGTVLIYLWSTSNATAGNAFDGATLEWVEK